MASRSSSRVNPRDSLILGCHPEALQRVLLRTDAVLPRHVDLQVPQREVGMEIERPRAEPFVRAGVANEDASLETLGTDRALCAIVVDLYGAAALSRARSTVREERVHRDPRGHHRATLPAGTILHTKARAEDLQARDGADSENRERHRDLEEGEALARHPSASSTRTVPSSGSSSTRRRCSRRSRRPATTTSAPLVLPFGKKSIWMTPSAKPVPPRTSSITARSVSTAHRFQAVVWMLFW